MATSWSPKFWNRSKSDAPPAVTADRGTTVAAASPVSMAESKPDCLALLLAAGSSIRFGADKLQSDLGGRPLLAWALAALVDNPQIGAVQVVGSESNLAWLQLLAENAASPKLLPPCRGGRVRSESTLRGLEAGGGDWEWVLVHDGARPFLNQQLIGDGLAAARSVGAAIAALPAHDTVQIVDRDALIVQTPERRRAFLAQTPQIARRRTLLRAHRQFAAVLSRFTDEASLLRAVGQPVVVFPGDRNNLKITGPADLALARAILAETDRQPQEPELKMTQKRIGQGHDLHRLEAGGPLRLCGIDVGAPYSAVGHSDADVGIHAFIDALLGALGLGDIGSMFPDSDPTYAGANSADLLWEVHNQVRERGWRIENVDMTIHLESPRLAAYFPLFTARLGGITNVTPYRFSVKAKTAEGLGAIGNSEAVAADCIVLLAKIGR